MKKSVGIIHCYLIKKLVKLSRWVKKEKNVYSLLGVITSLWLKPEIKDKPFVPLMSINGQRKADISDISENQLVVLKEIFYNIDNVEFKIL